jgi:trehalose-6-phosphate synthase
MDSAALEEIARREDVRKRAADIRLALGQPDSPAAAGRRMRAMRRRVREHDVAHWAAAFLHALGPTPG